jgi:hypothetical protein
MIVKVRDLAAFCVACGRREFEPLSKAPLGPRSRLKCKGCDARYTYLELIDQIGQAAMQRANKALDELEKRKKQSPKKRA